MKYISVMIPSSHGLYDVSMRRQQAPGLVELSWREHRQICSHMIYGVAGVEEGTLIVPWFGIIRRHFHLGRCFISAVASSKESLIRSMSRDKYWHGKDLFA